MTHGDSFTLCDMDVLLSQGETYSDFVVLLLCIIIIIITKTFKRCSSVFVSHQQCMRL